MRRIELDVDRVILEGVPAPDRAAFAAAIAAELERLAQSPALAAHNAREGSARPIVSRAHDARSLGVAVARAVFAQVPRSTLVGEDG